MYWQTAQIKQRLKSTFILWALCVFAASIWVYYGNLGNVKALANQAWVVNNVALLRWISATSMYPLYVLFIGFIIWGKYYKHATLRFIGWGYVIAQLAGSGLLVRILKIMSGHVRPEGLLHTGNQYADAWIGPSLEAVNNSFPSGHTCDLFVSGMFLSMCLPKWWMRILAMIFAAFNGVLRVVLIKHFPLDVLGGILIAGLTVFLVWQYWITPRIENAMVNDDII